MQFLITKDIWKRESDEKDDVKQFLNKFALNST